MPSRSAVSQLPEAVRKALEQRLLKGGFSDYEGLTQWLQSQGFDITRSSVHRFGQKFEERVEALKFATDQAKAIVEASPDEEGAVNEALIRLIQEKLFTVIRDMEIKDPSKINLTSLVRSVADIGRSSITQKKWAAQTREKMAARFAALEKEAYAAAGTLDMATLQRVREEVYGLI